MGKLTAETFQLVDDISVSSWLREKLRTWPDEHGAVSVASVIPADFPAHARLLHPVQHQRDGSETVRWRDVAQATGRTAHPNMQWERIASPRPRSGRPPWTGSSPAEGELSPEECRRLAGLLRVFTTTPDACYFCYWAGYAVVQDRLGDVEPSVRLHQREYHLFRGSLAQVGQPAFDTDLSGPGDGTAGSQFRSPSIWLPEDRSWCVATEVDLDSTYIAGSEECIDALIDSEFEVMRIPSDARVDVGADTINT